MKAITFDIFGGLEEIKYQDVKTPEPETAEVQIKIAYAGVNPVDWKIGEGYLRKMVPHQFPIIPGWDAAGTISSTCKTVTKFQVGDEVFAYCRKPVVQHGTYAEFVCFPAEHVAKKPQSLTMAQAAAIPLVGLTAWQALFDNAKLKSGQTILIHAGAGGVGSIAIGLAKNAGATVFTTASEKNHEYVKELGADVAIDYTKENFVDKMKELQPEGVDVVFDCVGHETLENSFQLVKPGGHIVSIVNLIDREKGEQFGIDTSFVFVRPNGAQLEQIAILLDEGKIHPPKVQEFPFSEAAKALEQVKTEHTRGKIVIRVE